MHIVIGYDGDLHVFIGAISVLIGVQRKLLSSWHKCSSISLNFPPKKNKTDFLEGILSSNPAKASIRFSFKTTIVMTRATIEVPLTVSKGF